jgi:transcriptional regulator with XRE-family HTH domain
MQIMVSVLGEKETMTTLGSRIRDTRLARNLSQAHVASVVGISLPTYRKIESGDGTIEFRHVVRTLAVLGYVDAVAALVPPLDPTMTMKQLLALPERKRASTAKRKA